MKDTAGAIELIAHAANLSVPHSAKLPVRLTTAAGSTIRQAETLVETDPPGTTRAPTLERSLVLADARLLALYRLVA